MLKIAENDYTIIFQCDILSRKIRLIVNVALPKSKNELLANLEDDSTLFHCDV